MKYLSFPLTTSSPLTLRRVILSAGTCVLLTVASANVQAQFDDFSDGDDTANPAWTHLSGYVSSTLQTWTVSGGTYRLTAPNNGALSLGFVGSYTGGSYSDVIVMADFVSFGGPGANGVFGVAARLNGNNGAGALTGYAYAYEPFAASGAGEMVLYRVNPGVSITDLGSQQISLDPLKDYRFVLEISGSSLHGQVFEIGGGMVAERFAVDGTYASGFSGVLGYSQTPVAPTDFTLDNFSAAVVPEPGVSALIVLGAAGLVAFRRLRRTRV